ncbi:MAG: 50S ribosomal protein L5 [Patescibacteria group bacterium]|nr:50S ribosomal protein L5 [Patescibacteria group bacterium]
MIGLKEKYNKEVIPKMMEKFGYKSRMAVPKIEKVVINTGFGKAIIPKGSDERRKMLEAITKDLSSITGQKPVLTKARKSVSGFKIRRGMEIGAMVTLRKKMMFDFLERLIHITLPRSRDFSGIDPKTVDKNGNLTLAIKEQISFSEIMPEHAKFLFGLEITVVTTTKDKEESLELLRLIGFPIKK